MKNGFFGREYLRNELNLKDVVLTQTESSNSNLRDKVVQGMGDAYVEIGQPFVVFSNSLDDSKSYRYIRTSPVVSANMVDVNKIEFETENSKYLVEYIG